MKISNFLAFIIILFITACTNSRGNFDIENLKVFGETPFEASEWQAANPETRGAMLYDLLSNYSFIGKKRKDVNDLLGNQTGYYEYDENPAYLVGKSTASNSNKKSENYLFVFITDHSTGMIQDYLLIPQSRGKL